MYAMVLHRPGEPLVYRQLPDRRAGAGEVLIEVGACGVCRTDLHVVDDEVVKYETALKADKYLLMIHGTAEELSKALTILQA
jgi:D-arabinose 1-dehydrogenase-like Zn-dependent alcohol dehydrogenase